MLGSHWKPGGGVIVSALHALEKSHDYFIDGYNTLGDLWRKTVIDVQSC